MFEAPALYATMTLLALLCAVAIIDARQGIIPDWLNAAIGATGLLRAMAEGSDALMLAVAEALIAGGLALALRWAYRKWRGFQGLGLGDVKFVAAVTPWIGLEALPVALLVASLSGLAAVLILRLRGSSVSPTTRLAFGPHLAAGAAAVWLFAGIA